jgi:hypothetical protein
MSEQQNPVEAGSLNEEEMAAFTAARQKAANLLQQLGSIELQKGNLIDAIRANEKEAQAVLATALNRLEISEETPWRFQNDGKIFTLPAESAEEASSEG